MSENIDYLQFISQKQIDASIEDSIIIHYLSGGTFETQVLISNTIYMVSKLELFSDHCDCKVKNKCNKVLPIILSNN